MLTNPPHQGLNLDALAAQGKFSFVDGLSRLFLGGGGGAAVGGAQSYLESPRLADVARALHAAVERLRGRGGGGGGAAAAAETKTTEKIVLVLDQPDALLAAAGAGDGVTSASLRELVLDLREVSPCSRSYYYYAAIDRTCFLRPLLSFFLAFPVSFYGREMGHRRRYRGKRQKG